MKVSTTPYPNLLPKPCWTLWFNLLSLNHKTILREMIEIDLVGFHTKQWLYSEEFTKSKKSSISYLFNSFNDFEFRYQQSNIINDLYMRAKAISNLFLSFHDWMGVWYGWSNLILLLNKWSIRYINFWQTYLLKMNISLV